MNVLVYDSEVRRGCVNGTLRGQEDCLRGLLLEAVLCAEKLRNGSRIAWPDMVRYVEGAWTGHWRDTDGAKTDWKLIPDSKWLFRNCSVMFP